MIIEREVFKKIEPFVKSKEAIVITGMRRTGKTTTLNYFYNKINSGNKLFLDLENPINRMYFEKANYEEIKSNLEFMGLDFNKKAYVFLDEIQFIPSIPSIAKYFIDHYGVKFFMTGSASFYLKNLFSESLSGRKYIFEIYPLNFREFLKFKNISFSFGKKITREQFLTLKPLYEEYMNFGGFPEVVLKKSLEEKLMALRDIFASFFNLEIVNFGDFRRNDVIKNLLLLLMERTGSMVDMQRLSKELGVSRPTLYEYISFLEGVYFIKRIRPLSRGKGTEIRKRPKIYICDTGFINTFVKIDKGRIFENSIFQILNQKGELNFYRKKSGAEIDFILDKEYAYEVKLSGDAGDFKKLKTLAAHLSIKNFKVITLKYTQEEGFIYPFQL